MYDLKLLGLAAEILLYAAALVYFYFVVLLGAGSSARTQCLQNAGTAST